MITSETLQIICKALPDVTEDIKWGQDLCFCVAGKMFFVVIPDKVPIPASFKTTEDLFNELTEKEGFQPAPYVARHKWVYIDNINRLNEKEWKHHIITSYELVKVKLPKKKK
jgi:predicted DNA-binding protein (MmcQ/YjbR family)